MTFDVGISARAPTAARKIANRTAATLSPPLRPHRMLLHAAIWVPGEPLASRSQSVFMTGGRMRKRSKPPEVVVTGASAGVGRATVRAFAERGAWIGLIARGHDGLEAARREVEELGGRALVLPLDVAEADLVELAAAQVEEELGP